MGNTVRITGVDKVIEKVKVLQGLYPTQVDSALMYGAECITNQAKYYCPVDVGNLRERTTAYAGESDDSDKRVVCIGTNVDYAVYVEFGTGIYAENGNGRKTPWAWEGESLKWKGKHWTWGSKPHPYLRPAFDEKKEEAVKRIAEKLKGELLR